MQTASALCLALALLLTCLPSNAQSQTADRNWSSVEGLSTGDKLEVYTKDKRHVKGLLKQVDSDRLTLSGKKTEYALTKSEISTVYRVASKSETLKYSLIGAAAGAAIGAGIGVAQNSPPKDDGEIYVMLNTPIGAGIGAVAGALFGKGRRKRVLIYQTP